MNQGVERSTVERTKLEVEAAADGVAEIAVEDTQHDRNRTFLRFLVGAEDFADHDGSLDVDHVVLGEHRDGAGMFHPGSVERGAQRRIADDHRDVLLGCLGEVAIGLVAFDHHHRVAGVLE